MGVRHSMRAKFVQAVRISHLDGKRLFIGTLTSAYHSLKVTSV
jgi:hypothetical protein